MPDRLIPEIIKDAALDAEEEAGFLAAGEEFRIWVAAEIAKDLQPVPLQDDLVAIPAHRIYRGSYAPFVEVTYEVRHADKAEEDAALDRLAADLTDEAAFERVCDHMIGRLTKAGHAETAKLVAFVKSLRQGWGGTE